MDYTDFIKLYKEKFIDVYSDLIVLTANKPKQVLIEQSNILSHLVQYKNPSLDKEKQEQNLTKAYNHLVRVTLDCHKITWAFLKVGLEPFVYDPEKLLVFNIPVKDVLKEFYIFEESAKKARKFEETHIGDNPLNSIELYEKANKIGYNLYKKMDISKVKQVKKFSISSKKKELGINFVIALIFFIFGLIIK